jgi:hypothetical protein
MRVSQTIALLLLGCSIACQQPDTKKSPAMETTANKSADYAADREFLQQHTSKLIELTSTDNRAKVLLSADFQGRVMTSTATGDSGISFGWLNRDLIAASVKKVQFNPFGGEERFWLGPEGGQYSLYFKGRDSFDIKHWQVPAVIDTLPYQVDSANAAAASFSTHTRLVNYSGTSFDLDINRTIRLLDLAAINSKLGISIPDDLQLVGYESLNRIKNIGTADWTKEKGLLSIWLLGMFTPSPKTVVIIPFRGIADARTCITDNYFGEIPAERLQVKDSVLFFTCDGRYRSKIGIAPRIAKPLATGFDFEHNVLTIVIPTVEADAAYVNSKWELQKDPYKGDVINAYNDGPLADGTQMGPFFEIESSSPALQLKKGQTGEYRQTTVHLTGSYASLRQLVQQLLGVNLDDLKK